jgi:hypothetical protein
MNSGIRETISLNQEIIIYKFFSDIKKNIPNTNPITIRDTFAIISIFLFILYS